MRVDLGWGQVGVGGGGGQSAVAQYLFPTFGFVWVPHNFGFRGGGRNKKPLTLPMFY